MASRETTWSALYNRHVPAPPTRLRVKARRHPHRSGGLAIDTLPGTTDVPLPPPHHRPATPPRGMPFDAKDAVAQQLREIATEVLGEIWFHDGGRRAHRPDAEVKKLPSTWTCKKNPQAQGKSQCRQ
ncbi:hypothetical protein [Streptomyces pharetrae]|uniref:hypothetical protein n=1 Tax=Streptomyces pharetrae TaxID=291370 RepID=UPI00117D0D28